MKISTALALIAGLSTTAAPLGAVGSIAAAAPGAMAQQVHIRSESLYVNVYDEVQTGTAGDSTLWEVRFLSVASPDADGTGSLSAGITNYTCPAGLTPSTPTQDDGGPSCDNEAQLYLTGYGLAVAGDSALETITVSGLVDQPDLTTWEVVDQHEVELTFTGTGKRTRFSEETWGATLSGWKRAVTTVGEVPGLGLDGHTGEATWQQTKARQQKISTTDLVGEYSSLTSEPVLDKVRWEQTALRVSDNRWGKDSGSQSLDGHQAVWICEPGVHPIEDEEEYVDEEDPACVGTFTQIWGEGIQIEGDGKLRSVSATGTAYLDDTPVAVDLTFTGVGTATREKTREGDFTVDRTTRDATLTGTVGDIILDGAPAALTYTARKGFTNG